jgi:hypothetical protein
LAIINFHNIKLLFGKTKVRSQMLLVATEDGRLVPEETPARKGCAVDDDKLSAFLLDASNLVKDEVSGIAYQLVGERSCAPICLLNPREDFKRKKTFVDGKLQTSEEGLWGLIKGVFHNSWVADLIIQNRKAAKMKRDQMLLLLLGSTIPLGALVIAIKVIRG